MPLHAPGLPERTCPKVSSHERPSGGGVSFWAMRAAAVATIAVLLSVGCGGTSSETPWPVEPMGTVLGPSGESAPAGARGEPEPEPEGDAGAEPAHRESPPPPPADRK